ncbi:MAG: molybdopterin-synthase adenylyltransferase MoeB [Pseudomonadota bacterium]
MDDQLLLRYSRQIMLPYIEYEGQQKIIQSRVLIIGLGGLGSPVAMYLAASGVGHLVLCDDDQVDLTNLQRQIIHTTERIGEDKVSSAKQALQQLNPEINITTINHRLDEQQLSEEISAADVVIDGSDNFRTRFLINKISVKTATPLVSGAAIKTEGQISVFNQKPDSPCYSCLYKDDGSEMDSSCSANGILAPVVGMIGTIQALEALKIIAEFGETLDGRVQLLDAFTMEWRQMKLKKDPLCPVCSA